MRFKAYFDGGSRGNPGPVAAAMVIYDEDGQIVSEKSKNLGTATNNTEWEGLCEALKALTVLANKHSSVEAEIFGDSQLIVN